VEVVHRRCAGIDISKKDAKVCVRVQGSGRRTTTASVTTWGAMSNEILALREHLIAEKVTCVVMESTGDYWKPFYYLLEDAVNVMLVNPRDARNRPGRKTDVSDSAWLADLGAHGLLRASLVPPPPIRRLRDLTRARTDLNRDRVRQIHRLEKILQDAGIKLSSVATDIMGQSSRAMLEALIAGKTDPAALADLAKRRLRSKIPALTEALTGRFTPHHGYLIRMHLDLIDSIYRRAERPGHQDRRCAATVYSGGSGSVVQHPGLVDNGRRGLPRRDRWRHDRVSHRRAPRLLGRSLSRCQRIRGTGQIHQNPRRQPQPQRCSRHRCSVGGTVSGHLLRRQVPPHLRA
jgi:hypothetical protein